MASHHLRTVDLQEPPRQFLSRAYRAIRGLGWTVSSTNDVGMEGNVPMSLWSWGERISIQVLSDERAQLRCANVMALPILDFGRNRRLVDKLLAAIDSTTP